MIRLTGVAIAASLAASVAGAQNCVTPPAKAPWLVAQHEALAEKPGSWSNDSLRSVLVATIPGMNMDAQMGWQVKNDGVTPLSHLDVIDNLKKLGSTRGSVWPLRSVVGVAGVRSVFYLAQRDTVLLRSALKRMMEGGLDEGLKSDIAILEDQARLLAGRKQLYGTQLAMINGKLVPLAIEDSAHVDMRREGATLPPLAWSVCNANAVVRK